MKLDVKAYVAKSIVEDFGDCGKTTFRWFVSNRKDNPFGSTEEVINECFTAAEIELLRTYLKTEHDEDLIVEEVKLPLPSDIMPISDIPVGGDCDFYMLDKYENYDLPFQVWGYFEKPYDVYHQMDKNGKFHEVKVPK